MNTSLTPFRYPTPFRGRRWPGFPQSFFEDLDRFFEDFWGEALPEAGMPRMATLSPSVDVTDTGEAYKVSAELPGLDEKDVEILVRDDVLTIKGEKRADEEKEGPKGGFVRERRYGAFERRFQLPSDGDADKIDARFDKGVLTIMIPKTEAKSAVKRIAINGG